MTDNTDPILRAVERDTGKVSGGLRQPAGGPTALSPQAVSAKGAHQAQDLERLARASFDEAWRGQPNDPPPYGELDRKQHTRIVRAILTELREPSEGMVEAGKKAGGRAAEWTGDSIVFHAVDSWPAMIDHILAEQGV